RARRAACPAPPRASGSRPTARAGSRNSAARRARSSSPVRWRRRSAARSTSSREATAVPIEVVATRCHLRFGTPSEARSRQALRKEPGERLSDLGVLYAVVDHRLEIAELVAAVVASALELIRQQLLIAEQARDGIGQLDLAPGARLHRMQVMENPRRQNVASDHTQRGRCRPRLGLLDDARDAAEALAQCIALDDPVTADLCLGYRHDADDRVLF